MAEKIRSLTLAMKEGAFTAFLAPPGLALPSPGIGGRVGRWHRKGRGLWRKEGDFH